MYYLSLPIWDLIGISYLNYNERFDLFKKSLSFQSCRKNVMLTYILLMLDLVWFSVHIITCYEHSTKNLSFKYFYIIVFVNVAVSFLMNLNLCFYLDWEDYINRRRAAEVLSEEAYERMENILTNEEVEDSQEISVPTVDIIGGCATVESI